MGPVLMCWAPTDVLQGFRLRVTACMAVPHKSNHDVKGPHGCTARVQTQSDGMYRHGCAARVQS